MLKGRAQQTIPEGPLAGLPIEVAWDTSAGLTSNRRGVATVQRFDAAIGPDRQGRTYRLEVGFEQGRARVAHLTISAARPLPRQVSVDVDELVRWAVRLYAMNTPAVFKIDRAGRGSWRLTPASRRAAHSLAEHQDVGVPREVTDSFLGDVARIYEDAVSEGRAAWTTIQEHYGVSHATVGNWLQAARDRKILKARAPKRPTPAKNAKNKGRGRR